MKSKHLVFLGVLLALVSLTVHAQQGGYKGPGPIVSTVAEAHELRDNSSVTLQGKIERFLGFNHRYLFSDDTGSITLIISDSRWGSLSVDENDVVEITGFIYSDSSMAGGRYISVLAIKKV